MAVECDEWCSCSNVSITNIIGFGRLLCVCVWKKKEKKKHTQMNGVVYVLLLSIFDIWVALYIVQTIRTMWQFYIQTSFTKGAITMDAGIQISELQWQLFISYFHHFLFFRCIDTLEEKKKSRTCDRNGRHKYRSERSIYSQKKKKKPEVSALYT